MAEENVETKSVGPSSPRSPQANNSTTGGKAIASSSSSPHSPAPRQPTARRVKLTEQQLENLTKDELAAKWREQDLYVECLEAQTAAQEGDLASLRESEDKYRQQYVEASHREKILVRRLASKEQELQEYINQIAEMKAAHAPSAAALRSALLDPAVNILIQKLRQELVTTKAKLEDTQNELSAWKFTPDSNTGKRLMAKCRLLYQENEELGRMIASGRIAKLEGELALQKSFSEEVKKSQSELDEFLQDLDEDVEGMQSTIYFLQQELRKARESVTLLQQENAALKSTSSSETTNNLTNGLSPHTPPIKKEDSEENINANVLDSKANLSMKTVAENSAMSNNNNSSSECKGARTPPLPPEESPPPRNERESVEKMEPRTTATSSSSSTTTTVTPPTPTPATTTTTTSSSSSSTSIVTGTITSVASINQISSINQADNIDESSSDSAALIIKVETEDLSDRDENDDDDENENEGDDDDDDDENGRDSQQHQQQQQQQQQQLQQQHKEKRRNLKRTLRTTKSNHRNSSSSSGGGKTNGEDVISRTTRGRERTKRDKSAAGSDEERTTSRKKKRRESILSIDYNEADDDALVLTNGETLQSDPE